MTAFETLRRETSDRETSDRETWHIRSNAASLVVVALRAAAAWAHHRSSTLLRQSRLDARLAKDIWGPPAFDALASGGLSADEVLDRIQRACRRRDP